MADDRFAPLRTALLASATERLHLGVAAAGIGAALVARLLDLGGDTLPAVAFGLGALAYAAMVGLDVTNPEFVRLANTRVRVAEDQNADWINPSSLQDLEIREVYGSILSAMGNCRRLYSSIGEGLRSSLEDGFRRSEDLVSVAGRAARRSNAIRHHLDSDSPSGLERELERLRALAQKTADDAARQGFLQAAEAKVNELRTYQQLQGLRDRIHAQLKVIETSLDGLSAKLVKLEASDVAEAISINDSITEHVRTMTTDVEIIETSFEETMKELHV